MNLNQSVGILIALCLFAGCATHHIRKSDPTKISIPIRESSNPWTNLDFNNDPSDFQFAIVSDRTGHARPGVFEKAILKLNLLQPEFVICVGDLIEGYTQNETELDYEWENFDRLVRQLEMPFFYIPGNHDISNSIMANKWHERLGRSYYHFIYRNVLFLILNSQDQDAEAQAYFGKKQIEYIADTLEENSGVKWTLVFVHKPLWQEAEGTAFKVIEDLLQDRDSTVFSGHLHEYAKYVRNGRNYYHLATTGGGSNLTGADFGEFDHIAWVTMKDEGPLMANLDISGVYNDDIVTAEIRQLTHLCKNGDLITSDSILIANPVFNGAEPRLYLKNPSDFPIKVNGIFESHMFLQVTPGQFDINIPPGTNEPLIVPLKIEPTEDIDVARLSPLDLNLIISSNLSGQEPVQLNWSYALTINTPLICPLRKDPVNLDGVLDEWPKLHHTCREIKDVIKGPSAWSGPDDCSFQFSVEYTDDFIYIALRVIDDRFIFDKEKVPWAYDGIMLSLDARPEEERSRERGLNAGIKERLIQLWITPGQSADNMVLLPEAKDIPEGTRVISIINDEGYSMEMAVPTTYLNKKQAVPWKDFRLNIGIGDIDEIDGPQPQMWWRPQWNCPDNDPGSGTFIKQ